MAAWWGIELGYREIRNEDTPFCTPAPALLPPAGTGTPQIVDVGDPEVEGLQLRLIAHAIR